MAKSPMQSEEDIALQIYKNGWRQGSVFDPRQIDFNSSEVFQIAENELLLVCTQSCSVVSLRFSADPLIEVMAVKKLSKFNEKSPEATGKNQRKLHIKTESNSATPAIECDYNRRFFFDRKKLLNVQLSTEITLSNEESSKLAAWIGRSYTRIALPNELVDRMRSTLLVQIRQCLDQKHSISSEALHLYVPYTYIDWTPRADDADEYKLRLKFICNDQIASEELDQALLEELKDFLDGKTSNSVSIEELTVSMANETFLTDLNGFERLSEWDYISNLIDIAPAL